MSFELHERVKNTSCEIHNYTEIEPAVISPYTEATIRFVELKKPYEWCEYKKKERINMV